jgi:predicted DNA binding CopG/RHH family protein
MKRQELKEMPSLGSDQAAELFVETADLTEYNLSGFSPMRFEIETKSAVLNIRLPKSLLDAVKSRAKTRGIPYTRYVRFVLEQNLREATD